MKTAHIHSYNTAGAFPKRESQWRFRHGMTLLLGLFLVLLLLGMAMPYPDFLTADTLLRTSNPAASIRAKSSLPLYDILVHPGDTIQEGAILAVLENSSSFGDVSKMKEQLSLSHDQTFTKPIYAIGDPSLLQLDVGMQAAYQRYVQAGIAYSWQRNHGMDSLGLRDWEQRMYRSETAYTEQKEALALAKRELNMAQSTLDRYRKLHAKGIISDQEWENHENRYLTVQQKQQAALYGFERSSTELEQLGTQKRLAETTLLAQSNGRATELILAKQELRSAIGQWEERYVLESPITGRVVFIQNWQPQQFVSEDMPVFAIIPLGKQEWFAHCTIPMRNSGKMQLGQSVLVALDNYPAQEYGYLTGTVHHISEMPLDNAYAVRVILDNHSGTIKLGQEMQGTAKIIIEDTNLLQRIFHTLRHAFTDGTGTSITTPNKTTL